MKLRVRSGKRAVIVALQSIRTKIFLLILVPLLCYIILVAVLFLLLLRQSSLQQFSQTSHQSADLLISNLDSQLEITNSVSYSLLQNADVSAWFRGQGDMATSRAVERVMMQTYTNFSGIESVYLFRSDGESLNARHHLSNQLFDDFRLTSWYATSEEKGGGYFITLNADDTLFSTAGQNNISFIRQVYNLDTFETVGCLMINLDESFITKSTLEVYEKYNTEFFILNEEGQSLIQGQEIPPEFIRAGGDIVIPTGGGNEYFVYNTVAPKLGWRVISAMPYSLASGLLNYPAILLVPVGMAAVMNLVLLLVITRIVTNPIKEMTSVMKQTGDGGFEPLPEGSGRKDEIGQLHRTYNSMIGQLNRMIEERVALEREKQRYELDILNEQVKPHFLYNTLDTISYLILSGDNLKAKQAVDALSRFYSISLNKGSQTITLQSEVQLIKNYLTLQKVRYGDLIEDAYDIQPEALEIPVLRNILQPLVENCIYHGIKPSGEAGCIRVRAWLETDTLCISVQDDGMGMTPSQLEALDHELIDQNIYSFGFRGTVKRARLYYNSPDIYTIHSAPGKGTTVTLKLPVEKETGGEL